MDRPADLPTPPPAPAAQVAALLPGTTRALADSFQCLAEKLVGIAVERADQLSAKDAVIAAGIAVDKFRLLREQATSIQGTEGLSDDERLERLRKLAERVRSRALAPVESRGTG